MSEPTARQRFVEAMREWRIGHWHVEEDGWYSCPKAADYLGEDTECNCYYANRLSAKEAACAAFADMECGDGSQEGRCWPDRHEYALGWTHEKMHESCRASLRREVFGE